MKYKRKRWGWCRPIIFHCSRSTILFHFPRSFLFPSFLSRSLRTRSSFPLFHGFFERLLLGRFLKFVLPTELRGMKLPRRDTILVDYSIGPCNLFRRLGRPCTAISFPRFYRPSKSPRDLPAGHCAKSAGKHERSPWRATLTT